MKGGKAPITKKQISLLHVARSKLGLSEPNYRAILSVYGGSDSAKNMTQSGFTRVIEYFKRLGFEAPSFTPAASLRQRRPDANALIEAGQRKKIATLYEALGIDESKRQQGLCRRVIKKPWPQTRGDANKVIECMKAMLRRQTAAT